MNLPDRQSCMEEAERIYSSAFGSIINKFAEIDIFRRGYAYGLTKALDGFTREGMEFVNEVIHGTTMDKLFTDKVGLVAAFGGREKMVRHTADSHATKYSQTVDAASLFFAHAVVDQAAMAYCLVTVLFAPERWKPWILEKKVDLKSIEGRDYADVIARRAYEHCVEFENQSLIAKIDQIMRVCKPSPDEMTASETYRFDRNRLSALDNARHAAAHRAESKVLPNGQADIEFLQGTCFFMMSIVNSALGVKINPYLVNTSSRVPFA